MRNINEHLWHDKNPTTKPEPGTFHRIKYICPTMRLDEARSYFHMIFLHQMALKYEPQRMGHLIGYSTPYLPVPSESFLCQRPFISSNKWEHEHESICIFKYNERWHGRDRDENRLTISLDTSHGAPIITSSTYRQAKTLKLLSWRFMIGRCAPLLALHNHYTEHYNYEKKSSSAFPFLWEDYKYICTSTFLHIIQLLKEALAHDSQHFCSWLIFLSKW